jgi:putative FmdB family regulatory protein
MPTYDYLCTTCGGFDAIRALGRRDEPAACPHCGAASPRIFISAPRLALIDSSVRNALETNERARHEPKSSSSYAQHPAGCSCCVSGKRGATLKDAHGNKAFPSKRPWMISH